jgi:hypothetical protein
MAFGDLSVIWYIFSPLWNIVSRKIWQPCSYRFGIIDLVRYRIASEEGFPKNARRLLLRVTRFGEFSQLKRLLFWHFFQNPSFVAHFWLLLPQKLLQT